MTIFNIFILYAMSGQAIKELKNYEETKKKSTKKEHMHCRKMNRK